MEDFWPTLRKGDITVLRDNIDTVDSKGIKLLSGSFVEADYVLYATGWGDHFSFFSRELKDELGIPQSGDDNNGTSQKKSSTVQGLSNPWVLHDQAADMLVDKKLPLLGAGPKDFNGWQRSAARQKAVKIRRWRLYNRMIPLTQQSENPNIVILGQIHTTQTPTVAEVQALWAAAYLLGHISPPSQLDMAREVSEFNAWTRKRYASVGERYPYALFDWVPYLDRLMHDLDLKAERHNGLLADFFLPYGPHCYRGVVNEYMAAHAHGKKIV